MILAGASVDSRGASDAPVRGSIRAWLPALASAALALAIYAVTVGGTFIMDDENVARDDARLVDWHDWRTLWTSPYVPNALDHLWRPITSTSYAVQHWISGDRAWPFHAVNIVLYAIACAAVAELARRLAGIKAAWIAGLLFAAHPIHVEAVAMVIGRAEMACAAALFIGFCLFIGGALTSGRIIAVMACFVVALLTKEQGILMPAMLLALIPVARKRCDVSADSGTGFPPVFSEESRAGRGSTELAEVPCHEGNETALEICDSESPRRWNRQLKLLGAGFLWIIAVYGAYREQVIGFPWNMRTMEWIFNPVVRSVGLDRVLLPVALFGRYVALLFFPLHLSPDYGAAAIGYKVHANDPYLFLGLAGIIAWTALAVSTLRRRDWPAVFCLVGFALTLLMVLNAFFITGAIFGERLAFMPSAFMLIPLSIWMTRWRRSIVITVVAILVSLGSFRSFAYARQWNDALSFADISFARQPGSWVICEFGFSQHQQHGDWAGALRVAQTACKTLSDTPWPYCRCITAADALGEFDVASQALAAGKRAVPPPLFPWGEMAAEIEIARQQRGIPSPTTAPATRAAPQTQK